MTAFDNRQSCEGRKFARESLSLAVSRIGGCVKGRRGTSGDVHDSLLLESMFKLTYSYCLAKPLRNLTFDLFAIKVVYVVLKRFCKQTIYHSILCIINIYMPPRIVYLSCWESLEFKTEKLLRYRKYS